jgi:PKD domain
MMKILRAFALSLLLVILVPLIPSTPIVHAQSSAIVAVDPSIVSDFSKTQGTSVIFEINITNAPSINAFQVFVSFNSSVITVAKDAFGNFMVDSSGNVLANTGATVQTVAECVGGSGGTLCSNAGLDTVALVQTIVGASTASPTNGKLFQITFNIVGLGVAQLHLHSVQLSNAGTNVPTTTADGYFTNIDCPLGSGVFCVPPVASFTVVTSTPFVNVPVVFNASSSTTSNGGARISTYTWQWGDFLFGGATLPIVTRNPVITHTFTESQMFTVTLVVNDTYGISATIEHSVTVSNPPPQPDFTVQVTSPTFSFVVPTGKTIIGVVTVTSINDFQGTINLAVIVTNPCCFPPFASLTASLGTSTLKVEAGGSNTTMLFLSAPSGSIQGIKYVTVTGTFGATTHSNTITAFVQPPKFTVSCDPAELLVSDCLTINVAPGGNVIFPIFITSQYGFVGDVTISSSLPLGFTLSFTASTVTLGENLTAAVFTRLSVSSQATPRVYFLNICGTSRTASESCSLVEINVQVLLPPDFTPQYPSTVTQLIGHNATFLVGVKSTAGLAGRVILIGVILPDASGVWARGSGFPIQAVFQASAGQPNSTLVTADTASLKAGTYSMAILVDAFGQEHSIIIGLKIVLPPSPPTLIELHWRPIVAVSEGGTKSGSQGFLAGILTPSNSTAIYVSVTIALVDGSTQEKFSIASLPVEVLPDEKVLNIQLETVFSEFDIGKTFFFAASLEWGLSPNMLNMTSFNSTVQSTGSFTVGPSSSG